MSAPVKRRGGCIMSDPQTASEIPQGARARAPLPPRVDLTHKLLPVRDQGSSPKCVAYATCALKEAQDATGAYLSPDYIYDRRLNSGDGMTISSAMITLTKSGVCSERKYGSPDEAANAAKHKIQRAYHVRDLNVLKTALSTGEIAVISLPFYPDAPESRFWQKTGKQDGGHAIAVVGYDDIAQELVFRNSWGKSWNNNGYGKISYGDYQSSVWEAYACYDSDGIANPEQPDTNDKKSGCCGVM